MGTTNHGINFRISNPPRGDSKEWSNFGNLFLTADGKRGTLYLELTVQQLDELRATAADGRVKAKVGVYRSKPKAAAGANG